MEILLFTQKNAKSALDLHLLSSDAVLKFFRALVVQYVVDCRESNSWPDTTQPSS